MRTRRAHAVSTNIYTYIMQHTDNFCRRERPIRRRGSSPPPPSPRHLSTWVDTNARYNRIATFCEECRSAVRLPRLNLLRFIAGPPPPSPPLLCLPSVERSQTRYPVRSASRPVFLETRRRAWTRCDRATLSAATVARDQVRRRRSSRDLSSDANREAGRQRRPRLR